RYEHDLHAFATWTAAGLRYILMHRLPNFDNIADIAGRVAVLIWAIWQNRNAIVWDNSRGSPEQVGGDHPSTADGAA
ncbi:hypothetical protein L195_g038596, partial [Trifolium pratense]